MNQTLFMDFRCTDGSTARISLPYPRANLTGPEIKTQMNAIVMADVFAVNGAALAAPLGAQVVTTTRTEYEF